MPLPISCAGGALLNKLVQVDPVVEDLGSNFGVGEDPVFPPSGESCLAYSQELLDFAASDVLL